MSFNDTLSDMLARIRNGQMRGKKEIICRHSRVSCAVLQVMSDNGYIGGYSEATDDKGMKTILVKLKYFRSKPVISIMRRISKPGRRVYADIRTLPDSFNGLGIKILSTSKGVLSDKDAHNQNVGGEIICEIF